MRPEILSGNLPLQCSFNSQLLELKEKKSEKSTCITSSVVKTREVSFVFVPDFSTHAFTVS